MASTKDDLADVVINLYVGGGKGLRSNLDEALAASDDTLKDTYTKAEAHYRRGSGDGVCGECEHYNPGKGEKSGTCQIVVGRILSSDTCDYFERNGDG